MSFWTSRKVKRQLSDGIDETNILGVRTVNSTGNIQKLFQTGDLIDVFGETTEKWQLVDFDFLEDSFNDQGELLLREVVRAPGARFACSGLFMDRLQQTPEPGSIIMFVVLGIVTISLLEAKVLIERWRKHHNNVRPHSSLGYYPPAPAAIQPLHSVRPTASLHEVPGLTDTKS